MDAEYQGVDDRTLSNLDITPAQFYDENYRPSVLSPETALLWAVLNDGINCWLKRMPPPSGWKPEFKESKRQQMWREANHWIFNDPSNELYSFVSICQHLGIDPEVLRRDLRKLKDSGRPVLRYRKSPVSHKQGMSVARPHT